MWTTFRYTFEMLVGYDNRFMTHRNFSLKVGGEIGLSLPIKWTKVIGVLLTYRFCISVGYFRFTMDVGIAQSDQSIVIFRREARGAYHLFGGGVTYKTQLKDQLEVVRKHFAH